MGRGSETANRTPSTDQEDREQNNAKRRRRGKESRGEVTRRGRPAKAQSISSSSAEEEGRIKRKGTPEEEGGDMRDSAEGDKRPRKEERRNGAWEVGAGTKRKEWRTKRGEIGGRGKKMQ